MALKNKSLFLYGFEVTEENSSFDFRVVAAETPRQATLRLGYYSLTGLLEEIVRAQKAVAPTFNFFATANRTINGGTENRVTLSTSSAFYQILFASGPRASTDCHALIGFNDLDYSGNTSYLGSFTSGTALQPEWWASQYLSPNNMQKVFGSVNISASGVKEAIVWQVQEFWQCQFKFIAEADVPDWTDFLRWAIQQRPLEFTPEITAPSVVLEGTLEQTGADGKGLGFQLNEMLPQFPYRYDTGLMKFRKRIIA